MYQTYWQPIPAWDACSLTLACFVVTFTERLTLFTVPRQDHSMLIWMIYGNWTDPQPLSLVFGSGRRYSSPHPLLSWHRYGRLH